VFAAPVAGEREITANRSAAVLDGNNVVDLVGLRGNTLGELTVFTCMLRATPDKLMQ
jgi:hypothetical protein